MVASVFVQCLLISHLKLAAQETRSTKNVLCPILDVSSSCNIPMGFSGTMFFCQDGTDQCTLTGSADFPLSPFVVTTPLHRCSVANMAWDPLASVGRMLTFFGVWLAALTALTFILRVSFAGVQKARLDVHDISLPVEGADVLGCDLFPDKAYCSGTGKRISRIRSVARTLSSRRRVSGRATEVVNGHGSSLSILDASFKFARASYLVSGEAWSTVRMEQSF